MAFEILPYSVDHEALWDEFCSASRNATILHTRRFLKYHADRFVDKSCLIFFDKRLVGVFPAAEVKNTISSHPGATYGGIVHQGWLSGNRMVDAMKRIAEFYWNAGYQKLIYKSLPNIYAGMPAQDDLYALFRLSAKLVRRDLSCAIDLGNRARVSERRRRGLKKAQKVVSVSDDPALLLDLWGVIVANLAREHAAAPVHSLEELVYLVNIFPSHIRIFCGLIDQRVEAGVVLFNSASVWHAQYIASSEKAYAVSALDIVFETAIKCAENAAARFFDFGTSNEQGGTILNDGLYRFKSEFGGGGVVYDFFELSFDAIKQ